MLGAAADADKVRVLVTLGHAYKAEGDMAVRMAIADAMLSMKTFFEEVAEAAARRVERPPETPTTDAGRALPIANGRVGE